MTTSKSRGGARRRVAGVCALCHVDAAPGHFHTASHLAKAAAEDGAVAAGDERRLRPEQEGLGL